MRRRSASSASRSAAAASPIGDLAFVVGPLERGDLLVELSRLFCEPGTLRCLLLLPLDGPGEPLLGVALALAPVGLLARPRHSARSRSAAVSRALVAASARFSATAEAASPLRRGPLRRHASRPQDRGERRRAPGCGDGVLGRVRRTGSRSVCVRSSAVRWASIRSSAATAESLGASGLARVALGRERCVRGLLRGGPALLHSR